MRRPFARNPTEPRVRMTSEELRSLGDDWTSKVSTRALFVVGSWTPPAPFGLEWDGVKLNDEWGKELIPYGSPGSDSHAEALLRMAGSL